MVLWSQLPATVLEKLHLARYSDMGIDCATIDLKAALQAKWLKEGSSVSWRSASTFLAYGSMRAHAETLIFATPAHVKICKTASLCDNLTPASGRLPVSHAIVQPAAFQQHIRAALALIGRAVDSKLLPVTPEVKRVSARNLRPYQIKACEAIEQFLNDAARTQFRLQMACATGKTAVYANVVNLCCGRNPSARVAILVPSIFLLGQTRRMLLEWFPYLAVGCVGDHMKEIKSQVVICVYNSFNHLSDLAWDLIVVDEAHHVLVTEITTKKEDGVWAQGIKDLNARKFIFGSACMPDSEAVDFSYPMQQAIEEKYIVDFNVVVPVFDRLESYEEQLVDLIQYNAEWGQILAYTNNRQEAQEFAQDLDTAKVSNVYIDGTMSAEERQSKLDKFHNGQVRVIVSVYVLKEGVDLPHSCTCLFVRPRNSAINVTQCLGRILRLSPNKFEGYVVLPSTDEEVELRRFIRLLGLIDPRIAAAIRSRNGGRVDIVCASETVRKGKRDDEAVLLREVTFEKMSRMLKGLSVEEKVALIVPFVEEKKRLPKKTDFTDGVNLGNAFSCLRDYYRRDELSAEQRTLVESIPGWTTPNAPGVRKYSRAEQIEIFKRYWDQHKKLPARSEPPFEGLFVERFLRSCRRSWTLSDDERKALDDITPTWQGNYYDLTWSKFIKHFSDFVTQHGKLPPETVRVAGYKLGEKFGAKRDRWRRKILAVEHKAQLDEIWPGWEHGRRLFADMVADLKAFSQEFKRRPAAARKDPKTKKNVRTPERERILGQWIGGQTRLYRKYQATLLQLETKKKEEKTEKKKEKIAAKIRALKEESKEGKLDEQKIKQMTDATCRCWFWPPYEQTRKKKKAATVGR